MKEQFRKALNLARDEQWDAAHQIVQHLDDRFAAWIHAYLHRVEGDSANAGYWYKRAGKEFPSISKEDEWQAIFDEVNAN